MRIAFVHNLPSGGARRASYYQLQYLKMFGHEIDEYIPETANLEFLNFDAFTRQKNVYPVNQPVFYTGRIPLVTPYIHAFQGVASLKGQQNIMKQIAADIDRGDYDVVLAADSQVMFCPYALRYLKTPCVYYCHDVRRPYKHEFDSLKDRWFLPAHLIFRLVYQRDELLNARNTKTVVTNSLFSARILQNMYHRPVKTIRLGIDTDLFTASSFEPENYLLCVGALIRQKGYRFLIESLALVEKKVRPVFWIVANHIDIEERAIIERMADQLGVSIKIETVTDNQRLVEIYNRAKLFIYAPYDEALGLTPLEAMSCGTSVVAVGEGGVRETVPNRPGAWLVERDAHQFAEQVSNILQAQNVSPFADQNRDYVCQNWQWEPNVRALEQELIDVAQ